MVAADVGLDFKPMEHMQFETMCRAFSGHGGFVGADELVERFRFVVDQPLSRLARWIASRSAISISWRAQTLIPAFQFTTVGVSIRPSCTDVLQELRDVFDEWELALWFASPNAWLGNAIPVDVLEGSRPAVLQAARADRFIARG